MGARETERETEITAENIHHQSRIAAELFYWEGDRFNANTSTILTALIQEAAKCRSYASDVFISWQAVEKEFTDPSDRTHMYLFGFREMGVDGSTFTRCRLKNYGDGEYRTIWQLTVDVTGDAMSLRLDEVWYSEYRYEAAYYNHIRGTMENKRKEIMQQYDEAQQVATNAGKNTLQEILREGYLSISRETEEARDTAASWYNQITRGEYK